MELYSLKKVVPINSALLSTETQVFLMHIYKYIFKIMNSYLFQSQYFLGPWDPSMTAVCYHGVHTTRWVNLSFVLLGKVCICHWHLSKWCSNDIKTVLRRFLIIHWSYFTSGRTKLRQFSQEKLNHQN